ncbi:hypothetical protein Drorol1_Dr00012078 [Drosera rotundifolia]
MESSSEMNGEEVRVEMRILSGESITLSIPSTKTIQDLKTLLVQCFAPASSFLTFNLFLRGAKLGLKDLIGSHTISPGEFLVVVPFRKKNRPTESSENQLQSGASTGTPQISHEGTTHGVAESAWSEMMEDLSYFHRASDADQRADVVAGDESLYMCSAGSDGKNGCGDGENEVAGDLSRTKYSSCERKRLSGELRDQGLIVEFFGCVVQFPEKNVWDDEIREGFLKVLEWVNFLTDENVNCILLKEASLCGGIKSLPSCVCSPWSKKALKAFTFLNMLSGFSQLRQEIVTLEFVKDALEKFAEFDFLLGVEDLEQLAVLFPKVISFSSHEAVSKKPDDVLVICDLPRQNGHQLDKKAGKAFSLSKIINYMRKRETIFKRNLQDLLKQYKGFEKHGCEKVESLKDVVASMKEAGFPFHINGVKKRRRSSGEVPASPGIQTRCRVMHQLSPTEIVGHLRKGIASEGQIVHVEEIAARVATFTEIPMELSKLAKSAFESLGVKKLYSHQKESILASLAGKNIVVATLTSSGKSLCYNIPVLEVLSQNMLACAMYLFPTKALAQDQLRVFLTMVKGLDVNFNVGIYDGDTSEADRTWLRDNARVLITNPDMLHISILPCHAQFQRLLSNLRFVVIDEAHSYRGAFGSHSALILRRLRRLCSHVYGSNPSFVLCTATSGNPHQHAMELAGLSSLELIQKDGSPSGPKSFVLWNPPLRPKTVVESGTGDKPSTKRKIVMRRSSPIMELSNLLAEMVQHGLRCMAFCKTRKLCELVLSYTREILQDIGPELMDSVCAYRGGYMAEVRRRIEGEFFCGKLRGIAATNALELGIDVGHIDVTLHLGFPGTVASLWQQAGRSGRRGKPSLAVYVAFEGPLDQYFMRFPKKLFQSPIERCLIDAQNKQVLEQNLICAALEHPLSLIYDEKFFGSCLNSAIKALESRGYLSCDSSHGSARTWSYIGQEKMPSYSISIRAIESERYKVIDLQTNKVLEEIEESKAFFQVYEGAVYMNQGRYYLVKKLDLSSKLAFCQKADLKYYTKTRDYTDIHVVGGNIAYTANASGGNLTKTSAQANLCKVTTTWFGFRRIWRGSNVVFDTVELSLPKYSYESQAVWIRVPQSVKSTVENANLAFRAGLHAASHAVLNVVPLHIICDSSGLAPECANRHDTRYFPERILLYDQHPGGTGLSIQVQPIFNDLLTAAFQLLTSCCCSGDSGCPNCVQSLACHEYNEVLNKEAAIMIIEGVIEAEKVTVAGTNPISEPVMQ